MMWMGKLEAQLSLKAFRAKAIIPIWLIVDWYYL